MQPTLPSHYCSSSPTASSKTQPSTTTNLPPLAHTREPRPNQHRNSCLAAFSLLIPTTAHHQTPSSSYRSPPQLMSRIIRSTPSNLSTQPLSPATPPTSTFNQFSRLRLTPQVDQHYQPRLAFCLQPIPTSRLQPSQPTTKSLDLFSLPQQPVDQISS